MVFEQRICEKCGYRDFGKKNMSLGSNDKFWECPKCNHNNIEK